MPSVDASADSTLLSKFMLKVSTLMFFVATVHFGLGFYRDWIAFRGSLAPQPPEAFLGRFDPWHRVMQDTLFVLQETLGAGAAVRQSPFPFMF